MSLYNMMFGTHPMAGMAMALAGEQASSLPRFRDAWIQPNSETGEPEVVVYTRMGGGNAECWNQYEDDYDADAPCSCEGCTVTNVVPTWDRFLRMEDDDYDYTYRSFFFAPREDHLDVARAIMEAEPVDVGAKWKKLLEDIEKGELTEQQEMNSLLIVDKITEAFRAGGGVVEV